MFKQPLLFLSLLVTLLACNETNKPATTAEEIVVPSMGGEFRGVSIGDDYEKVLNIDPANTLYSMPDEIVYRLPVKDASGTWYEITYNFKERGLYDICLEIFPSDSNTSQTVSGDLLKLYKDKYGIPVEDKGYKSWRIMTANAHVITVDLTDSLIKHGKQMIQVRYNESEK
ncbi:MAG: hypothetical protein SGI87_10325 [Flavobacteriales bacterium]|nr:hypothetical protein [Flavobacteriales bacterium]